MHSLTFVEQTDQVKSMRAKAVTFLLENKEEPGIWRFFGKDSNIDPDLDDSACALATLLENNMKVDERLLDYFLQFKDSKTNLFYTWIGIPNDANDICCIVNSDTLFFYSLMHRQNMIPEVIAYLNNEASTLGKKPIESKWSYYPFAFMYVITRAEVDGGVSELNYANVYIQRFLCLTQKTDGSWGDVLQTALSTTSLLNVGYAGEEIDKGILFLLSQQNQDGSFPCDLFFIDTQGFYGSEELTTAICLEALAKYKRNHQ